MNYEEKYNQMVQRCKELHESGNALTKQQMEIVCPELRESEDERIREQIEQVLIEHDWSATYKVSKDDCLAYLERQKECVADSSKTSTDEDERIRKRLINLIRELAENKVPIMTGGYFIDGQDKKYIAWLEKQNNCLACDQHLKGYIAGRKATEEEKQKEQKPNIELIQRSWYMEGYHDREFDKEPKWIIKTGEGGPKHELNPKYGEYIKKEQKPAEWSEEDEDAIEMAIIALEDMYDDNSPNDTYGGHNLPFNEAAKRLKSIRPSWKPTEKEITALENLMKGEVPDKIYPGATLSELLVKLKKLYYNESIPSWKPSEEQMEALNAINCHGALSYVGQQEHLISLYNDIKKL